MSRQYIDHVNSTVGSSPCSYATLSRYNNGASLGPALRGTTPTGIYIVPDYSAPGYDTLTHSAQPTCGGYFDIGSAYQNGGGSCGTKFVKRIVQ